MVRRQEPTLLGLGANWRQFSLLVLVNAFVGAMVGLERTVVPLLAEDVFGLASRSAILSFLVSFGVVKALANLFAGHFADKWGRKRTLVTGWFFALPVPLLVIFAPSWGWVVFANVLLGINQGLCWSMTVVMKIDLVGPQRRGLAMGLNEFAGYLAVSLLALATGYLAAAYGLRPAPFYPGIAFASLGLLFSVFFVRETRSHAAEEARLAGSSGAALGPDARPRSSAAGDNARPGDFGSPSFRRVLLLVSWKERTLFAVSQAGMVNNLNDGMVWGLLPLFLSAQGLSVGQVGVVAATYPAVWALSQIATGALSDRWGRKGMIVAGMWVQAAGIALLVLGGSFWPWIGGAVLLGLGTALVYPTLLAAVSDVAHPSWRAGAVGVYRLWRDSGYAVGAILAGVLADVMGIPGTMAAIAGLTFLSGLVAARLMYETLPSRRARARGQPGKGLRSDG